ncbi:MAG: exosortase H [Nitrospiraceae bacterium]|nr:exosortase H [Nitrospiraceae bacterium]
MSKKNRNKPAADAEKEQVAPSRDSGISVKRFGLTYLGLMGAFFILISFKPIQNVIDLNGVYTTGVVLATSKVLGIAGIPCLHQGSIISLPSIALDIKFGCNGLEAVMIYSVAVIAFPSSWRNKLLGVVAGFVVIQVVNILRIAALAYSGIHFRRLFDYIHIYVAQGMMIAVSLGVFFLYLHYARNDTRAAS